MAPQPFHSNAQTATMRTADIDNEAPQAAWKPRRRQAAGMVTTSAAGCRHGYHVGATLPAW